METEMWYQSLVKPIWAPPAIVFGTVWSILYFVIILSFSYVGILFFQKQISFKVFLPFILNLIFNLAFASLQFSTKNNLLSSVDIFLVLATLIWAMIAIWKYEKVLAYIQIPYLLWIIFATALQFNITYLNWK